MENLFSEDPQFRRVQYKKLSDNVREWQQEIAAMVTEKLPKDLGVDATVVFQDVDDEKGYAIGTAIVKDTSSTKQIGVPIIVKSWHLAPLDLFFSKGQLYPLTGDNLAKMFFQNSLGTGLAPQQPPPNMVDDIYAEMRNPPLGGKYSYSSPFSAIGLLSGTLGAEDIQLLKEAVAKSPAVLGGFHRHGTTAILKKYAEEKPAPTEQDDINKDRAVSVLTVKKDGPDNYRLYSAADEVYDPVLISTNRRGAQNVLNMMRAELVDYEKDPMLVADHNGFCTIVPPDSPWGKKVEGGADALGEHRNPFVFNPLQDSRTPKAVDEFGRYGVVDKDGVLAKGWVIPSVVNFDGSTSSNRVFLGKALGAYQGRIVGIPLSDDDDTNLIPDRPDPGKVGVLVYRDGKDVFSTIPFQVTGVTIYKNLRSIAVIDAKGKQASLIVSPTINGIVKITNGSQDLGPLLGPKDNYFISAKLFFVRIPRLCQVSESPDDFKRKAAEWLDRDPIKVAMANGRYVFRSNRLAKLARAPRTADRGGVEKVAFDFNSLARHEAEFLLASWGLPLEKCAQALDGAKARVQLDVHHLQIPSTTFTVKTASPLRTKLANSIKAPIGELVKIASNLEDAQSVDAVLSLGFVNHENIARFASARPMLEEMGHMLAKLLLAARLGMDDIPEESVRSAIDHLQRVLEGLDRLRMLQEQESKTAAAKPSVTRHAGGRLVGDGVPVGFTR